MWIRFLLIGIFSLTASSLLCYQGVEIYQAIADFFKKS